MIRVLIRSRRSLSAEVLSSAISAHPKFRLTHLTETDEDLFNALGTEEVDVVLFFPDQPLEDHCIRAFKVIRENAPRVKLVVLTEESAQNLVVRAFTAGARGFCSMRESSLEKLCRCIERVHDGQIWANAEELGWVLQALERTSAPHKPFGVLNASGKRLLSDREEDVVKLVANGLQNREVAQALSLSEHTIKNYLFRIYDKLGISTRTELLLYVMSPQQHELRRVS